MSKNQYGGQAVLEGVMMRGAEDIAVAVRRSPDNIVIKKMKADSIANKYSFLQWPFIRGFLALFSSLIVGTKALSFSANQLAEEDEEEITTKEMISSIILSFLFAILLFVVFPASMVALLDSYVESNLILNFIEGIIKIIAFLSYLFIISRFEDIKRVFMYHGAEHKVIFTYEKGLPLTVENAKTFGTLHPRCGTNFLFIVILMSIFFFTFFGRPPFFQRIMYHVILLPLIAGTSYEIIKEAGGSRVDSITGKVKINPIIKAIATPGLYLQKLTTREPDDSMLEVAITALEAVLPEQRKDEKSV
ncbi:DUF1385 domain-containing protein [Natronospora cellulosivora (SeqCode)]